MQQRVELALAAVLGCLFFGNLDPLTLVALAVVCWIYFSTD